MYMNRKWRDLLVGLALLGLLGVGRSAEPAEKGYRPVTRPAVLQAALEGQLEAVRAWLDDKDLPSAAEAAQGLTALARLHSYQNSQPAWQEKTTALASSASRLNSAARSKNAAECARLLQECTRLLEDLGRQPPGSAPAVVKDFKPQGSTKTWMLLMDAAYSDAKTARTPQELEQLASAIAEEVNAYQFFRNDDRWRQDSLEVRSAALAVAEKARARDLAAGRMGLKSVYRACESCHERTRRK
jgi:hypothetical protein